MNRLIVFAGLPGTGKGRDVIGDSVNPWTLTRNAWRNTGLPSAGIGAGQCNPSECEPVSSGPMPGG